MSAGLVAVLAVAAVVAGPLLAAAVIIVQVLFTLGGVRPSGAHEARSAAWLALVVAVAGTVWTVYEGTSGMRPVAVLLGPALLGAVAIQLLRHDGRPGLTGSLTLTVAACTLAALPVAWVALRETDGGVYAVGLGLLGVGTVALAEGVPLPIAVRRALAVLAAGGLAAGLVLLVGPVAAEVPAVGAVVVASFAALTAVTALAAVDRIGVEAETGNTALAPVRISLPIVATAPVAYVVGRILVG
ncbi:MAG TPA: hypothetical protein VJ644_11495 [Jiangellaceae bacterium]|nr:hypothetical protein [Jiangellaceae bacterium]